jgi:hypothetical protein
MKRIIKDEAQRVPANIAKLCRSCRAELLRRVAAVQNSVCPSLVAATT